MVIMVKNWVLLLSDFKKLYKLLGKLREMSIKINIRYMSFSPLKKKY